MASIALGNDPRRAFVDEEDLDRFTVFAWQGFTPNGNGTYARRYCRETGRQRSLHHDVLGVPSSTRIDHIDGDGLNNRRKNLRVATAEQNCQNARLRKDNTIGYKGVHWEKWTGKYRACIVVNKVKLSLGRFSDPTEAARIYDNAARQHFGEFGRYNFPNDGELAA